MDRYWSLIVRSAQTAGADPAIVAGLHRLIGGWTPPPGAFAAYRAKASWAGNVDGLVALVDGLRRERGR